MTPEQASRPTFLDAAEQWAKRVVAAGLRFLIPPRSAATIHFRDVRNILVVRQHDQLGDMLCVVPLLRALKTRFPDASIVLIASPVNFEVMQHQPHVHEVWNYEKRRLLRSPAELFRMLKTLRSRKFDLAVVPSTVSVSLTSNLLAYLSGARFRMGVSRLEETVNPLSGLFDSAEALSWAGDPHRHQTLRNLDVLRPLGISTDDLSLAIGLTEEEKQEAARLLMSLRAEHKILLGFHPGAGKMKNRWPAERFAELANRLSDTMPAGAVITAGPKDDDALNGMLRHIRCPHLVVRRQPIRTVAAIAGQLGLFVSNDTGIMHVVAASGVPTLSLFGPTDPLQWAPNGQKHRYLLSRDGRIVSIAVDEVFTAARQMLSTAG